jgi:hypothetical protein
MKAVAVAAVAEGDDLLDRLKQLNRETAAILGEARAEGSKNNDLALKTIARVEKQIDLERRLLGEIKACTNASVATSPEWQKLRAAILLALEPFPTARLAVAEAVKHVGA